MSQESTPTKPLSAFYSTNLNPIVNSYEKLATRIAYTLGYPQINIEAHQNQVFENISIAIEMFSKFAGYTEELLTFNSRLYEPGKGLRMDVLFTATKQMTSSTKSDEPTTLDTSLYEIGKSTIGDSPTSFAVSYEDGKPNMRGYDYLTDDYRRVVDIFAFEEGSSSGINTLFTIEQTLAQQTYFSYAMGKYGFDLISWFTLKNWLDTRRKLLSQDFYFRFDDRTQTMFLSPEPNTRAKITSFYGIVGAYVERPVSQLVSEQWVYQYSLALTKIIIGRIRGKYSGTNLFGGGQPNFSDLLGEGNAEKEKLENRLYENVPGFGDGQPPMFFIG
jgi:hypothetical protein